MNLIHTIYEPSGAGPHPTILTLHGRGANALDLLGLAPYLCNGKFLMICPQGPLETPIGPGAFGYAWYPMSMGGPPDIGAILSSRNKLQISSMHAWPAIPSMPRNSLFSASVKAG